MWNCTLIPPVQNSCCIIYKGLIFNYSMQDGLSAAGWCIHTLCCVLLFFPGTHPGKSNPQWGTPSSCSVYTALNFPGILSAGAIWQGRFFIAQNTFSCQWRFSVLGLVWCVLLVCGTELDADVKPSSYQHRSLGLPAQSGRFCSKWQIIHGAPGETQPKQKPHSSCLPWQGNYQVAELLPLSYSGISKNVFICFPLLLVQVLFHILTPLGYNCVRQEWGQMRFPARSGGVKSQNVLWLAAKC